MAMPWITIKENITKSPFKKMVLIKTKIIIIKNIKTHNTKKIMLKNKIIMSNKMFLKMIKIKT